MNVDEAIKTLKQMKSPQSKKGYWKNKTIIDEERWEALQTLIEYVELGVNTLSPSTKAGEGNDSLREYFISVEKNYAIQTLKAIETNGENSKDFMYVSGEYNACKNIVHILKIDYKFCL